MKKHEDGFILPLALFALLILAALSGALLAIGRSEAQIAGNHLTAVQAQYMAEAGLEDAFEALQANPANITAAPAALTTVPSLNGASPTLAKFGRYTVQYQTAGPHTVRVVSTGFNADGTATKTLTVVYSNSFSSGDAVLAGGSLTVSGSVSVSGTCGSVYTSGDLTVTGSPSLSGNLTAGGTYSSSGSPSVGGVTGGNQPAQFVPNINPADFLAAAKTTLPAAQVFQMKANGQVLDGSDAVVMTLTSGGSYRNWTYTAGTPAQWSINSNTGWEGTYYFEGNVTVSGSPGGPKAPWVTTLISTGSINMSGSPVIEPNLPATMLVAGTDISISGSPTLGTSALPGLVAAHEQIGVSGSVTMYGTIIAQANASSDNLVSGDTFNGHPTVTFDCTSLGNVLLGQLRVLSWGW